MQLSAVALRLAAGDADAAASVGSWQTLYRVARRERLAALAWSRCGAAIRRHADDATVLRWRALFADATVSGERLLAASAAASDALAARGLTLVLLKGAPLAERLYGDAAARCSDDVDGHLPAGDRAEASRALADAGWRSVLGAAPGDETFALAGAEGELRLELHSSLVADRLSHLPAGAPEWRRDTVGGRVLAAHDGPLLPAYLAAHLATHFAPPLLWWLDLRECWRLLSTEDRAASEAAARRAGLERYLAWGLRGVAGVEGALAGDARALARLGVTGSGRRDTHQLWRHLALAPSAKARVAAARGWARPSWAAERDGGPIRGTVRRLLRHGRSLLPTSADVVRVEREASGPPGPLSARELIEAARAVVGEGGELRVALTGESMAPTLRPGDHLLLGAPRARPRVGDIVLAVQELERPVIHRVVSVWRDGDGDRITTRGDNCTLSDPAVPADAVLARVVASQRGGVWTSQAPSIRFGTGALLRGVLLALRARLARTRRLLRRRREAGRSAVGVGGSGS